MMIFKSSSRINLNLILNLFFVLFGQNNLLAILNFSNQTSTLNFLTTNAQLILKTPVTFNSGTLNLKDNSSGTISGDTASCLITFQNSILKTGNVVTGISGTFDPTGTDAITMNDGDLLDVTSGSIAQAITVASAATATIRGQPNFASTITLTDATSVLKLSIATSLNQSVTGAGKISLLSDLTVAKSIQMPSLINQNNFKLIMTGGNITTDVTNTTGGTIEFSGNTALSALWTIGTGSDVYVINGNGSVLDLSGTGGITFNGTSLYINDIHIKGVQTANALKGTGTIYLSNVTITLNGDFVRNDGSFIIHGDNCKLITKGNTFTMDGAGHNLTVDKKVLFYELLDGTDKTPFAYTNSALEILNNGGLILNALNLSIIGILINKTTYAQTQDIFLSTMAPINVVNPSPGSPRSVAYDGSNLFIHFPNAAGTFLNLDTNINLTLSNSVLKDFHHSGIYLGTSATMTYGDGVRMELGQDLTIASGDTAWAFNGNAEIDGNGATLRIQKSQGITITGAKTLTFKNIRLELTTIDAIKALTDSATIAFSSCEIVLQNAGFTLSTGNMTVAGFVKLTGGTITSSPQSTFELGSKGTLTIGENAELFVDRNIKLRYNIDPANDLTLAASKRHINMAYTGSAITLCGCSLESTATGLALDSGTLRIQDRVSMTISTATGAEAEFGSNLQVNLSSGAILDVDGPLKYIA